MENAAARLVIGKTRRESASSALKILHWLNIEARIMFKVLLLVHKSLRGKCSDNLQLQYKSFNGRSDEYMMLETPNYKTVYGRRLFSYNGSRLWNALPVHIRAEEDTEKFKKNLKTLLFKGHNELGAKAFKYTT